ncbi:hypothetical protein [Burkholderia ubonensis]
MLAGGGLAGLAGQNVTAGATAAQNEARSLLLGVICEVKEK